DFEGGLRFVLAAAWLFCPETVEYRGCVFLEDRFDPANVDNWFRDLDGSREHVEIMVNAVALWDVFTNTDLVDENRFGEELPQLAMAIGECWQGILSRRYPDRDVTVRVTGEEDRDYGPTVTFWTQPARGPRPED
ncbi:MAG TPA: hypothetical protein VF069_24885, partial [Streptosporangiaceae bacterium]